jgi:hypothetical protein
LIATAALVSATVLISSPAAFASIDTTGSATDVANALAGPGTTVNSASWVTKPDDLVDPTTGYHASPDGVSDTQMAGFPTVGSQFAILTTGDAHLANQPQVLTLSGAPSVNLGGGNVGRGNSDHDVSILKVDFTVGARMNCLSFDFRFLTSEFVPGFQGVLYNDAFIAELDTSDWSTNGTTITANHNFAFDPQGHVISVHATQNTSMSQAPSDVIYAGATPVLTATTPVSVGDHSLYLSIFDHHDNILDSAVFVDNLIIGHTTATQCAPGAAPKNFALGLTPKTKSLTVGDTHTVSANVTELDPTPVPNGKVLFSVTGANTANGSGTTDANGNASWSYQGTNAGTDTITACYDVDNNGTCDKGEAFDNAAVTWAAAPPPTATTSAPAAGGLLPITGSPVDVFAGVGLLLLIAGGVTLLLLRRRRVVADAYVSPASAPTSMTPPSAAPQEPATTNDAPAPDAGSVADGEATTE